MNGKAEAVGKMLGGFMAYLRKSEFKGIKYKASEPEPDYAAFYIENNSETDD